ncbi:response regulator transcription factor [Nocardia rhamnosiphila]
MEIARRLSRFLADGWPHRALVIFTRECTGRPRKVAGDADIVDRITLAELDALKSVIEPGAAFTGEAVLTGACRWVWAIRDPSDALLVLIPRDGGEIPRPSELMAAFGIVATSIRQQVAQASPDYLAESRAASSARTRAIAELTASHEAVLTALLLTLRSPRLDDAQARATAIENASDALIALRSEQATDRALTAEPPVSAFERLRRDLGPLLQHREIAVDYTAPPIDGRPIPGEIAHGARAMTQSVILAFAAQPCLDRLRIAWQCETGALVVDVRDNAAGRLDSATVRRNLEGRVRTLRAEVGIEVIADWGSRVTIRLPLDPPTALPDLPGLTALNRREREVLTLVAAGMRNKAIAAELGVAESTVKFHIAGLLKKLDVSSRGEAAAIGMQTGLIRLTGTGENLQAQSSSGRR